MYNYTNIHRGGSTYTGLRYALARCAWQGMVCKAYTTRYGIQGVHGKVWQSMVYIHGQAKPERVVAPQQRRRHSPALKVPEQSKQ